MGVFFLSGLTIAAWVVSIPEVQNRTGVSHAVLGSLLLLLGLGSFVGMTSAGPVVDRIGSRSTIMVGALLSIIGVNLPGLATAPWMLGVALFVFGLGVGSIDVSMNDQAVIVERAYGRPIMSSFHAFFSIGGFAGSLLGVVIPLLGLTINWTLGTAAVVAAALTCLAYPALLQNGPVADETLPSPAGASEMITSKRDRALTIALLAGLAFALMLAEGSAGDWSALHAIDRLHVTDSAASLAYGAFAIAMTVGRLTADRIAHRFGPVNIVRFGSLIAGLGMAVVVLSPLFPVTLIGWVVFGLGLSGIVPQIFTAAGRLGGANQGAIISRVVGAGYIGLLAGPAVIGWVSQGIGLDLALLVPLVCCAVGVLLADRVERRAP